MKERFRNSVFIMALGSLALACAACAPLTPPPGASSEQLQKDVAECKYEAEKFGGNDVFRYADLLRSCLEARGWR